MRILHVDTGREMRGGQRQVILLMRGLRERGQGCVLLARAETPVSHAAREAGFEVHEATLLNLRSHSQFCELVHAHDARAHTLAALASGKPFVVSRRVAFPVKRGMFSRWKYSRARRYLAVSRFVAAELARAGVPCEKIDVVYDSFERSVTSVPAGAEFKTVALGSNDPAKGRALVEEASHLANIPVIFSDDLARDLPGASLFVYATRSEGLGSAALFAMSLGIPVLASRVGGLPEIIEEGASGLLVENEPRAFAQAMLRLRDDSELRMSLARNAQLRVEGEFSPEKMIEDTLACYRKALAG